MPLTFPSHLAAVLPLKLWRPHWFDGVALVTGAVAPDVVYLAMGFPNELPDTHTLPALFWWCLPVALAYAWAIRRASATIAIHLPRRLQPFGALSQSRHPAWITVISALLGATTHIGWDWLTHTDGWLRQLFGLDWYAATGIAWWTVSDLSSTLLGGIVAILLLVRAVRRPNLFSPQPQAAPARPRRFWATAAIVATAGLAVLPFLPSATAPAATGVRLLHLAAAALLTGALAVILQLRRFA
ncbi:MAG TPA: DUF4184 family protein [Micromonosporaceae bacterium]|nr:DUF4184 family protein [Micromonosporaceae bacterium]